jgi:hypothetical protein
VRLINLNCRRGTVARATGEAPRKPNSGSFVPGVAGQSQQEFLAPRIKFLMTYGEGEDADVIIAEPSSRGARSSATQFRPGSAFRGCTN